METDADLLLRYARKGTEAALAEIVRRHIDFVYQTALRQVGGDAHHAADVAQYVFTEMTRKAATLARHRVLKGWLFSTACHAAANIVRSDRRRRRREQEAHAMQTIANEPEPSADWATARPLINDALAALSARDREAVLLRYFEGRDYAEIGARCSLTADAARLRVERALEKMRAALARAGVASGAAALANTLTAQAALSAPAGLAASVTATALASGAAGGGLTFLILMSMTKVQIGLVCAALLAGGLGVAWRQRTHPGPPVEATRLSTRQDAETRRTVVVRAPPAAHEPSRALAEASPGPATTPGLPPLTSSAELRPAGTWQDRGRATPEAAWETLFWAMQAHDYRALARVMGLAPEDRRLAETLWARVPEEMRGQERVESADELFALIWDSHNGGRFTGIRIDGVKAFDADFAEVLSVGQRREDGRMERTAMDFRRGADGWQMVVSTPEAEQTVGEAMLDLHGVLKPAP